MTLEEHLKKMREIDVRDIDPSTLMDIKDIHIDLSQPPEQRLASLIQQTNGNPYFFRSEGLVVKCSFRGERRLQEILEDILEHN
ncbi:DUF6870 family protein [Oscillospiraceae bacterium 50-16]